MDITEYHAWLNSLDDKWKLIFSYIIRNDFSSEINHIERINAFLSNMETDVKHDISSDLSSYESFNLTRKPVLSWNDTDILSNEDFLIDCNILKIIDLEYLPLSQIIERIFAHTHNKANAYLFFALDLSNENLEVDEEKVESMELDNLDALSVLRYLKRLDLYGLQIKDFSSLKHLKSLEHIEFEQNDFIDFNVLNMLPNLKELHFNYSFYPSTALERIKEFRNWSNIEVLNFQGTDSISDYSFLQNCTNLKELHFNDCVVESLATLI